MRKGDCVEADPTRPVNHTVLTASRLAVGKAETEGLVLWIGIPSQVLGALDGPGVITSRGPHTERNVALPFLTLPVLDFPQLLINEMG